MKTNTLTEQDLSDIGPVEISEAKNFFIEFEIPSDKFESLESNTRYETKIGESAVRKISSTTSLFPVDFFEQDGFKIENITIEENAAGNKTITVFIYKDVPEVTADNLLQTLQALFGVKQNVEESRESGDKQIDE